MSAPGPTTGFLALVMEEAAFGLDTLDVLRRHCGRLKSAMFAGEEKRAFEAACELLDLGSMPTAFAIGRRSGVALPSVNRMKATGKALYADFASAVDGVLSQHSLRELGTCLSSALAATQAGQLDSARAFAQEAAELALLGDTEGELSDFHEFDPDLPPTPRYITTTLATLNEDLGGGLASEGALSMSLVAAPSGVGKSTFAFQQVRPLVTQERHWVLYCQRRTGSQLRLRSGHPHPGAPERGAAPGQDPEAPQAFKRVHAELKAAVDAGRFTAYDGEDFSPERILELARRKARELNQARESGTAPATARLIVIVDNWDNLFTNYDFGALREDQVFRRWMQRFQRQAAEYGYHHMNLAQTNGEAEALKEAARGRSDGRQQETQRQMQPPHRALPPAGLRRGGARQREQRRRAAGLGAAADRGAQVAWRRADRAAVLPDRRHRGRLA